MIALSKFNGKEIKIIPNKIGEHLHCIRYISIDDNIYVVSERNINLIKTLFNHNNNDEHSVYCMQWVNYQRYYINFQEVGSDEIYMTTLGSRLYDKIIANILADDSAFVNYNIILKISPDVEDGDVRIVDSGGIDCEFELEQRSIMISSEFYTLITRYKEHLDNYQKYIVEFRNARIMDIIG